MKVTAVLVLLTLCSIAAANLLTQRHRRQPPSPECFDEAYSNFINNLRTQLPECQSDDPAVFCTDTCIGAACQFYADNDYDLQCIDTNARMCAVSESGDTSGRSVPDACVVQPGRDCLDGGYWQFANTLSGGCFNSGSSFCGNDCAGETCDYYDSNNYSEDCINDIVGNCNATVGMVPVGCEDDGPGDSGSGDGSGDGGSGDGSGDSGALGLVTVKAVLPVILLIAAFLIF